MKVATELRKHTVLLSNGCELDVHEVLYVDGSPGIVIASGETFFSNPVICHLGQDGIHVPGGPGTIPTNTLFKKPLKIDGHVPQKVVKPCDECENDATRAIVDASGNTHQFCEIHWRVHTEFTGNDGKPYGVG